MNQLVNYVYAVESWGNGIPRRRRDIILKQIIKAGALLCALTMLEWNATAVAEEKRLGDYIYVPAMSDPRSVGTISLRVDGVRCGENGEKETVEALSGAEFGVYVYSSEGRLTPWANPLYPSEPMRIRTGEGETRFTLPQETEFYLRQESAPDGYAFDKDTLIPVTGEEIVVQNEAQGELMITVQDALGKPISGVTLTASAENGEGTQLVTDENGMATLRADEAQRYLVTETELPQGVYAMTGFSGGEAAEGGVSARVELASRTNLVLEHPATGTVQIAATLSYIDEQGEAKTHPLADIRMDIAGQTTLTTDSDGQVQTALLPGTYDAAFSYVGSESVVLPFTQGQIVIQSGEMTKIELAAAQNEGRVILHGESRRALSGGSVSLKSAEGRNYGPYAFDAEGLAISDALPVGEYHIENLTLPENTQLGQVVCDAQKAENPADIVISVAAGQAAEVQVEFLTLEKQTFTLMCSDVDDRGEKQETTLTDEVHVELVDAENGVAVSGLSSERGSLNLEALSGSYVLRLSKKDAARLDVARDSQTFDLPTEQETITFVSDKARLMLHSEDENGAVISGGVYKVTDSAGHSYTVKADENGLAVTPKITAGTAVITTKTAPKDYDASAKTAAQAIAGEASDVRIIHESYGKTTFTVNLQSLDANGSAQTEPLEGAGIRIYKLEDGGQRMNDIGAALETDENGVCSISLAPGEYAAQVMKAPQGASAPQAVRFTSENTKDTELRMVCMDALGGVRVELTGGELTDEQMAQVRFELVSASGQAQSLSMADGAFYIGGLNAGTYVLRQTQMPEGYKLAAEQTVSVTGGEAVQASVPLEEYAVLTVSKTGLTFNDQLQTYIVPLTGEYGIYTMENGQLTPYPSASNQLTVWANAAPDGKKNISVKLPATLEGTTYYIKELSEAAGFAEDERTYEVTLTAGEARTVECAVSSDRGFISLEQLDAATGGHVSGGEFELLDAKGNVVLSFTMGDEAYRNPMAIPVGEYTLRQTQAADGYALSENAEIMLDVPPYLTQGGSMAQAEMVCMPIPESETIDGMLRDVYTAQQQGLTLLTVDMGATAGCETLIQPRAEIHMEGENGVRSTVASIVLTSPTDAQGGSYRARIEYSLAGGGWRPSSAIMTDVLTGPTAVSLESVQDDINAIRVTYLNAQTGEEVAAGGFAPGQITLNVRTDAEGEATLRTQIGFGGSLTYATAFGAGKQVMNRAAEREERFTVQGSGAFVSVSAGVDGKISGVAFMDSNANGLMEPNESARYAGLTVTLLAKSGEAVAACRTGTDGRYEFSSLSSGEYEVQFNAGESVIFSSGALYSEHVQSAVRDTRYGVSDTLVIDGSHSDYIVNAGCIYAGSVSGSVQELLADGSVDGFGGMNVEMLREGEDEPIVALTDDLGGYRFTGILPGEYEVRLNLPSSYLCEEAEDGAIVTKVSIGQGDTIDFGQITICRAAQVSGRVRIDDDGDGVIDSSAQTLAGVRVTLLKAEDGHTDRVAETVTDESGCYHFDNLLAGTYSVLFKLDGDWAFTRFGEDSAVYGAVAQSGSTQSFELATGETIEQIDAGVTIPAQLTVNVFKDTQADGQKGTYEEGFEGIGITLIRLENGEDAESITYKTDAEGNVTFAGVSPGEYVIAYHLPGQWRATKNADASKTNYPVSSVPQSRASSGRSEPFTLTMGQSGVRMYIGAMLSGSVSGMVYYDDDADAGFGEEESYCMDVTIELLDSSDAVVAAIQPEEDGSYVFEGVAPGRYRVRFTAHEDDCAFSGTERSMAKGGVQPSTGGVSTTRSLTVTGGDTLTEVNAGVVRLGELSGEIWEDSNGDGVQDAQEKLLEGVTVHLMNGTGRTILDTVATDENGRFSFKRMMPGDYKLRVDAPEGYVFSAPAQSSVLSLESEKDDRGYSVPFTLLGGVKVDGVRFGLLTQGTISGRIWLDERYDGRMEESEDGLRGASVALLNADGTEIASTQTIRSGEFSFGKLMPGRYSLRVTLTDGYVYTVGGIDSAAERQDEATTVIDLGELAMGEALSSVNIGALMPATVGGVVWYDGDDDGRRQSGDSGMQGVNAVLTVLTGYDAGRVYETTTDENGVYSFSGVMPGQAEIQFTLPDGYAFAKNAGGTRRVSVVPAADSLTAQTAALSVVSGENNMDLDVGVVAVGRMTGTVWLDSRYDGVRQEDESGVSGAVIELLNAADGATAARVTTDEAGAYEMDFVRTGDYIVRVTLPDGMMFTCEGDSAVGQTDDSTAETARFTLAMGEGRESLDIGAITASCVSGSVMAEGAGLGGAVVTLMQGGTVVANAQTAEDGSFAVMELRPGEYSLRVALPEDTLFAENTSLELAHADAQEGQTPTFTLGMGEQATLQTVQTVHTATVAGRAWQDSNADGRMDADEPAMAGVEAELLNENGDTVMKQTVGDDGRYSFKLIRSGVYAVRFTLPGGELFADRTGEEGGSCVAPAEGNTATTERFALASGEKRLSLNVGTIEACEIGDTVWLDSNANGLQDYREPLLEGVQIALLSVDAEGNMIQAATTLSDQYGYYHFRNLRPGDYVLRLDAKPEDKLTLRFGAPLGEIDSDLDPQTGMSDVIHMRSGEVRLDLDIGLVSHDK